MVLQLVYLLLASRPKGGATRDSYDCVWAQVGMDLNCGRHGTVWCCWAAGSFGLAFCPKTGNCRALLHHLPMHTHTHTLTHSYLHSHPLILHPHLHLLTLTPTPTHTPPIPTHTHTHAHTHILTPTLILTPPLTPQVDVKVHLSPDQEQEARMVTAAALAESARQLAQSAADFGKDEEVGYILLEY